MKKLYTFLAVALLAITGASAKADLRDAVRANGELQATTVAAEVRTPKLNRKVSAGSLIETGTTVKTVRKAPAKVTNLDDWEPIGKAKYTDGLLYAAYSLATPFPAYEVDAYVSKTNPDAYLLYDVYPTSYLNEQGIYAKKDNTPSTVVFTVNSSTKAVTAAYDLYLIDTTDSSEFTVQTRTNGTYNGGNISYAEQAFYCCYDGAPYALSLAFDVMLPGAEDYSFSLTPQSDICNADNKWSFTIAAGADVAGIKWGIFNATYSATAANLKVIAQSGNSINPGSYNYQFGATDPAGYYTLLVAAVDASGNVVGGDALYFYNNHPINPDEWVSLGMVDFTDDTFEPIYFRNPSYPTYKIELLENKANPGQFCMVNPYKDIPVYNQYFEGHSTCDHYIIIDASDLSNVTIPMVPMGINLGYPSDLSLENISGGKIENGALTFPTKGLVVYEADLSGYYANQSGKFKLQVPNLIKVTALVDGTPVEGATVTLEDWSIEGITTDADGVAYIPYPADNTKKIIVYKDGYDPYELAAVTARYDEQTANLVAAKAQLTVTVIDGEGEPVADAWVYFQDKEVQTGENGQVVIADLNGPAVLGKQIDFSVYKDGYEYYEGKADFSESLEAYSIVTLEASKAQFTVTVLDGEGEPVADAWVYFQDKEVQTGENGQVVFADLNGPAVIGKQIDFSVYKDGYEYYEGKADFSETLEAYSVVTLEASKAQFTVNVLDAEGEPVADAWVYFQDKEAQTGENGQVVFADLNGPAVIGKQIDFSVYKDGYEYYEGKADFSETLEAYSVVTLEASKAQFTVNVLDAEGEPVADAWVYFQDKEAQTGENGQVVFADLNGPAVIGKQIDFSVYKDGYEYYEGKADFSETLEAYSIVNLETAKATLTVIAIDGASEEPVAGAKVEFLGQIYTTDETGKVTVTDINALEVLGKQVEVKITHELYATYNGVADFTETLDAYVVANLTATSSSIDRIMRDIENGDTEVYDLNGRRVLRPSAGNVYIIKGVKVLVK